MSYITKNLMSGEQVIYTTKLHWVIFIVPVFAFLIGLVLLAASGIVGGILMAIGVISFLVTYLNFLNSEFGVTNKRLIIKEGIISRNSLDMVLKKVESIIVNQGIQGRIFGYGSLLISGTGGTTEPFHKIKNPLEFRKHVNEQVEKL